MSIISPIAIVRYREAHTTLRRWKVRVKLHIQAMIAKYCNERVMTTMTTDTLVGSARWCQTTMNRALFTTLLVLCSCSLPATAFLALGGGLLHAKARVTVPKAALMTVPKRGGLSDVEDDGYNQIRYIERSFKSFVRKIRRVQPGKLLLVRHGETTLNLNR